MQRMTQAAKYTLGKRCRGDLLRRFKNDESGSYLIIGALTMPVLVGFLGLGTDVGLWYFTHQKMQRAADSAAVSVASAYATTGASNQTVQAAAVASAYGFATLALM